MPKTKQHDLVVQSNRLIESRYTLTTLEQRLVLAMTSKINTNDAEFQLYELTLNELSKLMNIDLPNIYHIIDNVTDKLMKRIIYIEDENGWLKMGWVSSCRYNKNKGTVSFRFSPELKPYLLHLQREFTQCSLKIITRFQSIYAVRIYQLIKQYASIGSRVFSVDELREILGIEKETYKEFKEFKRRVLMQAKKEFDDKNNKCDLTFDLETIKDGRKIVRLKFIIVKQSAQQPQSAQPVQAPAAKKHPPLSAEMQEFEQWLKKNDAFMYGFMQEHGPNALMVQAEYRNFLERREEALQG